MPLNKTKDNRFYSQLTTQAIRHHDANNDHSARRTRALQQKWWLFQAEGSHLPKREGYPQGPQMPQGLQGHPAQAQRTGHPRSPKWARMASPNHHFRVHGGQ